MCFFGCMYMMSTCLLVLFVLRAVGTFDLCFRLAFAFLFKSPSLSPQCSLCLSARALPCKTKHLSIYIASHFDVCNKPVKHSAFELLYTENRKLQRLISIGRPACRFISVEFAYWKQKHCEEMKRGFWVFSYFVHFQRVFFFNFWRETEEK